MNKKMKKEPFLKCGICGGVATIGPYCGGPVAWFCHDCKSVLDKWSEIIEWHKKFIHKLIIEAKISKGMELLR